MTWFAFQGGYGTMDVAGAIEKQVVALGFHGYGTQAAAESHRNSVNLTQAPFLDSIELGYKATGGHHGLAGAKPSLKGVATGLANDVWKGLNISDLFLRFGEVLLGLVLLGVGIAKLTGTENAISSAAKTAGKVAMFA